MTLLHFQIEEQIHRNRLDNFLCATVTATSRMNLRNLLAAGACRVNGAVQPGGYHLQKGDAVEIEIDLSKTTAMTPENLPLKIVYEDADLIVVNKAAGMLAHPSLQQKSGTLLNALAYHLNGKDEAVRRIRPGLIHRLDRKTSGLMVISKNAAAHRILAGHFSRRLIEKKYLALVEGLVIEDAGTIDAPIGRDEEGRMWTVRAVENGGKTAQTNFTVRARFGGKTLLELEPVTGRTNQLRIHCAEIGHPIIGDENYGGAAFSRLCLHAFRLGFHHPADGAEKMFEIALPDAIQSELPENLTKLYSNSN